MAAGPAVPAPTKALQRAVQPEMRRVNRTSSPSDQAAEQRRRGRRDQIARELAQLLTNGGEWTSCRRDLQREIARHDRQPGEIAETRRLAQPMGES